MKVFKGILLGLSIVILGFTVLNIYTYFSYVKEIQKLEKEKLRLEIQILKSNN